MDEHEKDPKRLDAGAALVADPQHGILEGPEDVLPLPGWAGRTGANELLRLSEERLRLALDATSEVVWDWSLPVDRIYQGARWAEMLGYSPASTPTSMAQLRPFIHPDDLATLEAEVSGAVTGARDAITFEHRIRSAAGEWRWMLARARVVERNERGEGIRIVGTCADITAQKSAEDALREVDRRKERFLAVLSHELRNPLGAARNALFVLDRALPGSAQLPAARAILDRQLDQLTRLVEELLDVNRITSGKIQLQKTCVDFVDLARCAAETHRYVFDARRFELRLELPAEPVWATCDATRIAQVLGNLLQNAAKFTNRGTRRDRGARGRDVRDRLPARARHGSGHRAGAAGLGCSGRSSRPTARSTGARAASASGSRS